MSQQAVATAKLDKAIHAAQVSASASSLPLALTLSPGDRVLVARYGMFSHRWIDMCQRHGLDVQILDCAWGSRFPIRRHFCAQRKSLRRWASLDNASRRGAV